MNTLGSTVSLNFVGNWPATFAMSIPDLGQIGAKVNQSLMRANNEFEKIWTSIVGLTELTNSGEEHALATRRLLSYNPSRSDVKFAPNIKQAVDVLVDIVTACAGELNNGDNNHERFVTLGHCYLLLNDFPNAYTAYANALRENSSIEDPWVAYTIGCVYQHFKYHEEARKFYTKVLASKPVFPLVSDVNLRLAIACRSLGDYDQAINIFERMRQSPPSSIKTDDVLLQLAFTYQLAGRVDKANSIYGDLYQKYPTSLDIIQQYCWFLSLQNDKKAFDMATRIIEVSPPDPTLKLVTARIAMKQQDMASAYQKYSECISYWSDSPLFWCGLGVLYFKNEQMQDAIVAFQRALYLKGEILEAWANLGLIFELQNEPDSAIKIYQAAIVNCPDCQKIKDRLAALQQRQSRVAQSMIMEVNDSRFFTQVAERVANEYVSDVPQIPAAKIVHDSSEFNTEALDVMFAELAVPHRSLF